MTKDLTSKGLSWVGNIYQKLETFYHEMDNIVTQDTVRYVEDQVHNVSENMKKLYSDVVQDFIPQSCETQTVTQENSATNGSEQNGITEDLIPHSGETQAMVQVTSDADGSEHHGISEDLSPQSCETDAMEYDRMLNLYLVEIEVPDLVKNNQCDAGLQMYSPDSEELQNSNLANDLNHAVTVSDSSADEADCPSEDDVSDELDCLSEVTDSDEVEVIVRDETAAIEGTDPIDSICSSKVSSNYSDYSDVPDLDVGGSGTSVHFKSMSSTHFENENVDVTTSTPDKLLLSELADAGMETVDLSDKVKDDSCVIVDSSLFYEVPPRYYGNKSYKKKLEYAFSSKRRLVKEYELLAIIHGDLDVESRGGSGQNQLSCRIVKASDPEWEIL